MRPDRIQRLIDRVLSASQQQWCLRLIAVITAVGAFSIATAVSSRPWMLGWVLVTLFALASSLRPDSHLGVAVVALVGVRWLVVIDDVRTGLGWSLAIALCLLLFHVSTALMATAPAAVVFAPETVRRWVRRTVTVGVATTVVWVFANALQRREQAGNAFVTFVAITSIALAALFVRARSVRPR